MKKNISIVMLLTLLLSGWSTKSFSQTAVAEKKPIGNEKKIESKIIEKNQWYPLDKIELG